MNFDEKLEIGKMGESRVANYLKSKGRHILPVYEVEGCNYKGPVFYTRDNRKLVAPDLLCFKNESISWIEVKHKKAFSYHRITNQFVTGIDLKYFCDYLELSRLTSLPIYILFLHEGGTAKDSPESPGGLYGQEIGYLYRNVNHISKKDGMIYWAKDKLEKYAELEQVQ